MIRAATTTAAVCLVACPAALAHGGAGSGYRSAVTKVSPPGTGLRVTVVKGDDELLLRNPRGRRVVVLGYDGEPYLLFSGGRIFRNRRSPATYLNQDRYANVKVPSTADPKAPADWVPLATSSAYQWHDHRIHWMSPIPPPAVKRAKGEPHHVFGWKVPGTVDGRRLTISGSLDWVPVKGDSFPAWLLALIGVAGAAAVAAGVVLFRRRRRPAMR